MTKEQVETTRQEVARRFEGKQRIALQFSGGKDSLAALHLLKPWWNRLIVIWGNTGDALPEVAESIRATGKGVAEFHEVLGKARLNQLQALPVDLLPVRNSPLGRMFEPDGPKLTLQSRFECCWKNLWHPMLEAVKRMNLDLVVRAQRDSERLRNTAVKDGARDEDGLEIYYPIRAWSQDDVFAFLRDEGVELPVYYQYASSSLDCMHCTAYTSAFRGKQEYLRRFHPDAADEVARRMRLISAEVAVGVNELTQTLAELGNGGRVSTGNTGLSAQQPTG